MARALAVLALVIAVGAPTADAKKGHQHRHKNNPLYQRLAGHSLHRATSSPGTERWNFCRKGGFTYRETGGSGSSYYETNFHGRWRVASSTGKSGIVQYTVTGYRSSYVDGSQAEPFPGSPIAAAVTSGPFGVYFGGVLYGVGGAKC